MIYLHSKQPGTDHHGVFQGNNFINNTAHYIFHRASASSPAGADARNNYWGTTNTATIDSLIFDFNDDFLSGTVTYLPIRTEPDPADPPAP